MATKNNKSMDPDALERQLQRDLDTIRKYRELQARYGGDVPSTTPEKTATKAARPDSLVGFLEASLTDSWQRSTYYAEKAKAVRSTTGVSSVRNTLKRLVKLGIAEQRGDKASGVVEFRRKAA